MNVLVLFKYVNPFNFVLLFVGPYYKLCFLWTSLTFTPVIMYVLFHLLLLVIWGESEIKMIDWLISLNFDWSVTDNFFHQPCSEVLNPNLVWKTCFLT